ncbi:MAG TPA: hypothetical protein VIM75_13480 [Ohtaekwangia sp.]|uniref:hypothetical protein n=1 Tax=Ohtaekwangia sp. TaxID=2066019 RepID=UPI002F94A5EF
MKQRNYSLPKALLLKSVKGLFIVILLISAACGSEKLKWTTKKRNTLEELAEKDSVLVIAGISDKSNYGYTPEAPVKLGVKSLYTSSAYPEKYLQSLTGPHGEELVFKRIKSCCLFKTVNSDKDYYKNVGVLEVYKVQYAGLKEPVLLYINFFDQGKVLAPKGFLPKRK